MVPRISRGVGRGFHNLTRVDLQSRVGDKLVKFQVVFPLNGTTVVLQDSPCIFVTTAVAMSFFSRSISMFQP